MKTIDHPKILPAQQKDNEGNINPGDISETNQTCRNDKAGKKNDKDYDDDMARGDLDVSGSELDDEQENIGSDDEENNYYSLGGDDHNDLDEDRGIQNAYRNALLSP